MQRKLTLLLIRAEVSGVALGNQDLQEVDKQICQETSLSWGGELDELWRIIDWLGGNFNVYFHTAIARLQYDIMELQLA